MTKYNVATKDDIEEDDDVEEQVDVPDEKVKAVEPNTRDNVLNDDIDNDIIQKILMPNVDMANPFNVNSKVDDTNMELD